MKSIAPKNKALVHISDDNGKGVGPNISVLPIRTCSPCVKVSCAMPVLKKDGTPGKRLQCYACKFLDRPIVRRNWTDNTEVLETDPERFFETIAQYLTAAKPAFFRFWVGGDFPNQKTVNLAFDLARNFPDVKFLSFTKRWYDSFNFGKAPGNFAVIYSAWPTLPVPPKDKPRAWLNDGRETRIPKTALHCPGHCDACGLCWELHKTGRDVYFNIH
jgi:hypothetical protein